jgi:hypothetical protein
MGWFPYQLPFDLLLADAQALTTRSFSANSELRVCNL